MDRNLHAFLRVVQTGNLSLAAEQIGLAQPSLTKRLKALEDEYDVKLFERRPHGMEPTEAGLKLYEHAQRIEQRYLHAHETMIAGKSSHLDVIRIGAGPFFRSHVMKPLYIQLREEFPNIKLDFRVDVHLKNLPLLRNGKLDIVFGALVRDPEEDGLLTFQTTRTSLGILAHKSHPLAGEGYSGVADLKKTPWVLYSDDPLSIKIVEAFFARHGLLPPEHAVLTTSFEFGLDLVSTGGFVIPAATQLAKTYERLGIVELPLAEPIDEFPVGAYVRDSSMEFPAIKRAIEIAKELQSF